MTQIQSDKLDFKSALAQKAEIINAVLVELLAEQTEINDSLKTAINYTLQSPGKRLRGATVLWCCELIAGRSNHAACIAAAAVEMVHTYSLVHDDLPAMDDDDTRRGKPTCHKVFDEATAILTGDALLTLAFEVLSANVKDPLMAVRLIKTLAKVAGPAGMIAGQMADMENENTNGNLGLLQHIHINKTAKMFAGAAAMGAIAGGASDEQIEHLLQYGLEIGLGFQVADDILDVSATSTELGKTAGKDARQGKITYPAVVGLEESKRIGQKIADQAVAALENFDGRADILRQLAGAMLDRTK